MKESQISEEEKKKNPYLQIKRSLKQVKIIKPEQVTVANKKDIKHEARRTPINRMIIEEHPDLDIDNLDVKKFIDVRASIKHLIDGIKSRDLFTETEMENWYWVLKDEIMKKIENKEEFSDKDYKRMDIMLDHLKDLHRLIHGEKKIIQSTKIDFSIIRDLTKT